MTPKAHALLASIAAIKDGGVDMARARLATLDDLESGKVTLDEALPLLRGGFMFLGQTVGTMHDTAAVLAEPMSIPPAPLVEPAPGIEAALQAGASTDAPASSNAEQTTAEPGPGLYASRRKGEKAE